MKRVVVGLSGGVDSSVAAHILKEQGYEVISLFMKNWHDESVTISDECPWIDDSNDAMQVATKLGIPFQTIDLSKEYKERIVDYMFSEYESGRTPNPDVLCNREIKFDIFLDAAKRLKADFIATGHYCQKTSFEKEGKTVYQLKAGADKNKDQSYFLCQLNQEQLKYALFPIGGMQKPEVRKLAAEIGLDTATKKDSQGLCFVGKIKLPDFLQQQLQPKKGQIIEIPADAATNKIPDKSNLEEATSAHNFNPEMGKIVGEHSGAHYYTVGQRKGLNVGGTPLPLFVLATDVDKNIIYAGQGENHPGLLRYGLHISNSDIHWIREDLKMQLDEKREYLVRIRYRQKLEKATLIQKEEKMFVLFDSPQRGIAAGQFAAWYDGEELIGSGVIA